MLTVLTYKFLTRSYKNKSKLRNQMVKCSQNIIFPKILDSIEKIKKTKLYEKLSQFHEIVSI